jgi:hypothetical protein
MSGRSPSLLALRGRIGAYRLHATHDPRETTAAGRAAFLAKFEREVDPEGTLTPVERERRARAARSAHFAKLAYQSARARAQRKTAADVEPAAVVSGGQVSADPTS